MASPFRCSCPDRRQDCGCEPHRRAGRRGACGNARSPCISENARASGDSYFHGRVGGCRGAEGKPSRSQPAGVSRDLLAALSDERHGDPRKVTGSSQRSPLHAAGSGRCLHLGKCALMRGTEASNPACSSGESGANSLLGKSHRCPWGISPTSARPNRGAKRYLSAALFPSHTVIFNNGG